MAWCRPATSHYWANVDTDLCRHMASLGHNKKCSICPHFTAWAERWSRSAGKAFNWCFTNFRYWSGWYVCYRPSVWQLRRREEETASSWAHCVCHFPRWSLHNSNFYYRHPGIRHGRNNGKEWLWSNNCINRWLNASIWRALTLDIQGWL